MLPQGKQQLRDSDDVYLLKQAADAFRLGDRARARELLFTATDINPDNELIWLWRASLAFTRDEAQECLEQVLRIDPTNAKALQWMKKLQKGRKDEAQQAAAASAVAEHEPAAASNAAEVVEEPEAESVEVEQHEETEAYAEAVAEQPEESIEAEEAEAEVEVDSSSDVVQPEAAAPSTKVQPDIDALIRAAMGGLSMPSGAVESAAEEEDSQTDVAELETQLVQEDEPEAAEIELELEESSEVVEAAEEIEQPAPASEQSAPILSARETPEYDDPVRRILGVESGSAGIPAGGLQAEPFASCPVCEKEWEQPALRCDSCGALLDLRDLTAIARVEDIDRKTLRESITRNASLLESKPSFDVHRSLVLAYLNLRQSHDALKHAREGLRLKSADRMMQSVVAELEGRRFILAVDDSKTIQRMIATVLERELYRVAIAEDGFQALARLDEELPALVLLDITMPRMDGYQVCKVITGNKSTRHIPVLMLSGKDGFFDKVRGKMVGAKDYITKPFQPEALIRAIEGYMK